MQPLYGTDADSREYRLPAPWGSFILTESFGDVWEIAPSFDAVTEPDAAPAPVTDVMGLLDDLIQTGRNLTTDEIVRLLSTPRAQNFSAFTRKVLTAVAEIPAGDFLTYGRGPGACRQSLFRSHSLPPRGECRCQSDVRRFKPTDVSNVRFSRPTGIFRDRCLAAAARSCAGRLITDFPSLSS